MRKEDKHVDDEARSGWVKSKWALVVYVAVFLACTQSKVIQSMIIYAHVVNFPFWLHDTAYHGLPDARTIHGKQHARTSPLHMKFVDYA